MNYYFREESDINQTDPKEPLPVNREPSTTTTTTSTTPASPGWDDYDLEKPVPPAIDGNDLEGARTDFSGFKPSPKDNQQHKTDIPIQHEAIKPIISEVPRQPEIEPVMPRHPEEVRPLQPIQPEIPRPIRPETPKEQNKSKPIEPNIPRRPQDFKPITRPTQPEEPMYKPQPPEARPIEPIPTDRHLLQPENHNLDSSNEGLDESEPSPTPPQVVLVDVGKETATIDGRKMDDGSVVVDTHDVPKNEWTKINGKPSISCPPGFEADHNGVCLGM